jgi:hypothetical protein
MGLSCCNSIHQFDQLRVQERWSPLMKRCIVIGESPGAPGSLHFYGPIPAKGLDPVAVRRRLLGEMVNAGILAQPTLEDFKANGFFFDHAVRCQLPIHIIERDRSSAARYRSNLVQSQQHLGLLIPQYEGVWVMGYLARAAVANLSFISRTARKITPYQEGHFFISPYVRPYKGYGPPEILTAFRDFLSQICSAESQ